MAQEWPGDGAGRRSNGKGRVKTVAMESTGEIASVRIPVPIESLERTHAVQLKPLII